MKDFSKIISFLIPIQVLLYGPTLMGGFGIPNFLLAIIGIIGLLNTILSVIKIVREGKQISIWYIIIAIYSFISFVLPLLIFINGGLKK